VSSCTLLLVPGATWEGKPVALIDNIVPYLDYLKNCFAAEMMRCALNPAWGVKAAKISRFTN
jgi:hypothetical protein